MEVHTLDDAFAVYFKEVGDGADIPANDSDYDRDLGGWLLHNINGPLALVRGDGTVIYPEHNGEEWVIPV